MNIYTKNRIHRTHKHAIMSLASVCGVLALLLTFVAPVTNAAPNYQVNYQGKLTNASNVAVADGTYNMRFWLLASSTVATTSALWTESLTGTNRVQVTNGLFSVMLGSTSPLTGVDFNQTLYLGVEIGSTTGSAVWDGEMSPRKVLGTVPAAFEANKLDGIDSTQFVRNDATNTIASSSPNTLLTLTQNGVGDIFNLFDGTTEVFTMTDGGRMGLGTSSPSRLFTMQGGDFWLGGNMTATGTISSANLTVSASSTLGYASSTALTVSGNGFINALTLTGSGAGVLTTNSTGVVSASTTIGDAYISDALTLTNSTGLPISTGVSGLGTNVATFLGTPSSANLASALTDETGSLGGGLAVFSNAPTFTGTTAFNALTVTSTSTLGFASSTALTVSGNAYFGGSLNISPAVTTDRKISMGGTQVFYLPDQTNFSGTLIMGNGGGSLSHASGQQGFYNTFVGLGAGVANTTGTESTLVGYNAGVNSTGNDNTFFGFKAGAENTAGAHNVIFGPYGGIQNQTGNFNTIVGDSAGMGTALNSYSNNVLFGYQTGGALTIGSNNVLLGYRAGDAITSGANNIVLGYDIDAPVAAGSNQLSIGNLIFGTGIDGTGTTYSTGNIGIGTSSPYAKFTVAGTMGLTGAFYDRTASAGTNGMVLQTTGTGVTWVATSTLGLGGASFSDSAGLAALLSDETGSLGGGLAVFNKAPTFTGTAGFNALTVSATSTLGFASSTALTVSGNSYFNFASSSYASTTGLTASNAYILDALGIGTTTPSAMFSITGSGTTNPFSIASSTGAQLLTLGADGRLTMGNLASTTQNILINGGATSTNPLVGTSNVAIGNLAFSYYTSDATYNIALGDQALYGSSSVPMTGDHNFAAGYLALKNNTTGIRNNAIGSSALLVNTTGNYNGAFGANTLRFNTTGVENNAIGHDALFYNITGSNNTAFGQNALTNNKNGSHNTGIGYRAGYTIGTSATSSFNTYIGYQAGYSQTQGDYNLVLGTNAGYDLGTATSTTILGAMANTILANISSSTALGAGALLAQSNTMVLGGTGSNAVDIVTGTSTPWAKFSIMNNYGSTNALFDIATTTSSAYATSSIFRVNHDGKVGIGTTTPYANFTVAGTMGLTGAFYDRTANAGTNGMVLQTTGTGVQWVATSSLGITSGSSFSDSAGLAGLLSDETGSAGGGLAVFNKAPTFTGTSAFNALTVSATSTLGYASSTALTVSGNTFLANLLATGSSTIGGGTGATGLTINGTATSTNLKVTGLTASRAIFTGADNLFTTTGTSQYLIDSLSDETGTGLSVFATNPLLSGFRSNASSTIGDGTATGGLTIFGNATTTGNAYIVGNMSIGTTSASAHLTIDGSGLTGSVVAGIKQYFGFTNSTLSALYYGDETYITNVPTATSTLVGKMIRIADTSALGNTVRGLEVQAYRGTNTKGENTGIAGFGRTFGVRGSTIGDAGSTYLPAGVFAETEGTTQGNALRAYSGTITSENLVYFLQDTSNFIGTGLKMDFGNAGGSFAATSTGKFVDFKVGGVTKFMVAANGSTTIGDGTVSASLRIPYGGICVDNDGSCVSTTTGQIRSVTSALGNSDLAEMYFSNQSLKTGEIVSLSGGLSVERASEDSEENIIGVVSTKPGMTLGFDDTSLSQGETGYPVGLKGRVPVRLSTENGPIKKGDRIVLSSLSGIGMKATEGGRVVGIALEDFDGTKAYSAGFLNQFGDDMLKERVINRTIVDARSQDGCYGGGGSAIGETPCVAKVVKTTTVISENPEETRASMLAELKNESPVEMMNEAGESYEVGQALMFIELAWYQTVGERIVLSELATTTPLAGGDTTLWDRIKALATNFVDGVLSITGLKADRVEVKDELCVDGVCVTADDLRAILQNAHNGGNVNGNTSGENNTGGNTDGNTSGGGGEVTGGGENTGGSSTGGDAGAGSTEGTETPSEPAPSPTEEPPVTQEPTPEAPTESAPSEPVI